MHSKEEVEVLHEAIAALQKENTQLQNENEELEKDNEGFRAAHTKLVKKNEGLEARCTRLQDDLSREISTRARIAQEKTRLQPERLCPPDHRLCRAVSQDHILCHISSEALLFF